MHPSIPTITIRIALVGLFAWFGIQQLIDPSTWVGFLPEWTGYFPIPSEMLVQLNGWLEVVLSLCLIAGAFVKPVSIILGLHLIGIAVAAGGAIGVRDAALGLTTIAFGFFPPDRWMIDTWLAKKTS